MVYLEDRYLSSILIETAPTKDLVPGNIDGTTSHIWMALIRNLDAPVKDHTEEYEKMCKVSSSCGQDWTKVPLRSMLAPMIENSWHLCKLCVSCYCGGYDDETVMIVYCSTLITRQSVSVHVIFRAHARTYLWGSNCELTRHVGARCLKCLIWMMN